MTLRTVAVLNPVMLLESELPFANFESSTPAASAMSISESPGATLYFFPAVSV